MLHVNTLSGSVCITSCAVGWLILILIMREMELYVIFLEQSCVWMSQLHIYTWALEVAVMKLCLHTVFLSTCTKHVTHEALLLVINFCITISQKSTTANLVSEIMKSCTPLSQCTCTWLITYMYMYMYIFLYTCTALNLCKLVLLVYVYTCTQRRASMHVWPGMWSTC